MVLLITYEFKNDNFKETQLSILLPTTVQIIPVGKVIYIRQHRATG